MYQDFQQPSPLTDAPAHTPGRADLHRAALGYAARGGPVFPCRPSGKEPVIPKCPIAKKLNLKGKELAEHARTCSRDGHGYHDATTDPRKIHAWWNRWPDANIGVPTGERSGILALDVDQPDALEAIEAEHGRLPDTRTHTTGSGRMHYLFDYPPGENIRNSAGKLAPGLDVRGEGGYIVAPPSTTTRPYEVLDRLPLAELPAGLLEALRRPQSAARESARVPARTTAALIDTGGPIPAGTRDDTLTRIAGRLHNGTRSLEALIAELLQINVARCEPPLPCPQVEKIARSIHARTPCKQSKRATPEVLRELDALTVAAERHEWDPVRNERRASIGGHTDRDLYVALLRFARDHGEMIPAGVRVVVSVRALAEEAAIGSTRTVLKGLDRLRTEHRLIRRDGTGSGPKAGALVLLRTPNAKGNTHPPSQYLREDDETSVSLSVPPLSGARLRWSAPGFGGRLGKIRGHIIDLLEAAGTVTLDRLARAMNRRPYDLRTRTLPALVEAGVVVECSTGEYRLSDAWRAALERERENAGEINAAERQRREHERQRERFAYAWKRGELVSKEELARRRRDRTWIRPEERHVSGTIAELEGVSDPSPELVEALASALERWPHRESESPSWWAGTLWAYELVQGKPTAAAVEVALYELRRAA